MIDTLHTVNLADEINYERLEIALLEAAKEVGLESEVEDIFEQNYRIRQRDVQKERNYDHTDIQLNRRDSPVMRLYLGDRRELIGYFQVNREVQKETTSKEEVEKYLQAVSNRLFD